MLFSAALAIYSGGCGKEVPHGGVLSPSDLARAPRIVRRLRAAEVLPKDLDLVVRVDVARMRSHLGPLAAADLPARAVDREGEDLLLGAITKGDVVWVGLRMSDLASGDRVVVVEGPFAGFEPDAALWKRAAQSPNGTRIFDRISERSRTSTARIIGLYDRALAFVTPVEVDSVARILQSGPDNDRSEPSAEGLVSLDLRRCHLPAELEHRFTALAALVGDLERVQATANLDDSGLIVDAELYAVSPEAGARVHTFLDALRSEEGGGRLSMQVRGAYVGWPKLEQVDKTVHVGLVVRSELLSSVLFETKP
jgi:hypothetical protein